ncbi:hypothetical protein BDR07DRAFT_1372507 [Suillus spraguei]|nr:hypothetical protein BDR07DRAFT_1372507 [Suillus spraguei]
MAWLRLCVRVRVRRDLWYLLGTDQEWMAVVAAADENRSSGRLAQLKMLQAWKGGTPPQAGADGLKEGADGHQYLGEGCEHAGVIVCESESEKGLVVLEMDQEWMAVVAWKGGTPPQAGADGLGKEPTVTSILVGRGIGPPMWMGQGVEISGMIDSWLGHKYFSAEGGIGEEERMKLVIPWEFS